MMEKDTETAGSALEIDLDQVPVMEKGIVPRESLDTEEITKVTLPVVENISATNPDAGSDNKNIEIDKPLYTITRTLYSDFPYVQRYVPGPEKPDKKLKLWTREEVLEHLGDKEKRLSQRHLFTCDMEEEEEEKRSQKDIYGNKITKMIITCPNCKERTCSSNFTKHLERCMKLGSSRRAATRQINYSTSSSSTNDNTKRSAAKKPSRETSSSAAKKSCGGSSVVSSNMSLGESSYTTTNKSEAGSLAASFKKPRGKSSAASTSKRRGRGKSSASSTYKEPAKSSVASTKTGPAKSSVASTKTGPAKSSAVSTDNRGPKSLTSSTKKCLNVSSAATTSESESSATSDVKTDNASLADINSESDVEESMADVDSESDADESLADVNSKSDADESLADKDSESDVEESMDVSSVAPKTDNQELNLQTEDISISMEGPMKTGSIQNEEGLQIDEPEAGDEDLDWCPEMMTDDAIPTPLLSDDDNDNWEPPPLLMPEVEVQVHETRVAVRPSRPPSPDITDPRGYRI